jgi:hypothetical protein
MVVTRVLDRGPGVLADGGDRGRDLGVHGDGAGEPGTGIRLTECHARFNKGAIGHARPELAWMRNDKMAAKRHVRCHGPAGNLPSLIEVGDDTRQGTKTKYSYCEVRSRQSLFQQEPTYPADNRHNTPQASTITQRCQKKIRSLTALP